MQTENATNSEAAGNDFMSCCDDMPRRFRAICRGEVYTLERTNRYRIAWGLPPLPGPQPVNVQTLRTYHKKKPLDCIHRGEVIRQDTANLCGMRGKQTDVYACAVHGECSLGRYCQHQKVKTCVTCEERTDHIADVGKMLRD